MRLKDIFIQGRDYIRLAIVLLVFLSLIFLLGYFVVYKLIMKGKRKPSIKTMLLSAATFIYIIVVLGAVFLNRGSNYGGTRAMILYPFYSYSDAWNSWSSYAWRGIVLNIAMFVPLGAILPLWSKRLQSFWKAFIIGFSFTLFIEVLQYFLNVGFFDVDDLINNTLGALIGYGLMMLLQALINKRRLKPSSVLLYLSPTLVVTLGFVIIVSLYNFKEFGNLSSVYSYPLNMHNVTILSDINYTSDEGQAMVYQSPNISVSEAEVFGEKFFHNIGAKMDKDKSDFYDETAIFYSEDRAVSLWVNYKGGTYRFSGLSYTDIDMKVSSEAKEQDIREALSLMNINIPQEASFYYDKEKESFVFKVDLVEEDGVIYDGTLWCDYYEDGTIKGIENDIISLKPYKEVNIISQQEAYSQIKEGKFIWWGSDSKDNETIVIQEIALDYQLDSKGFYQPVYVFSVKAGENDMVINIPAKK